MKLPGYSEYSTGLPTVAVIAGAGIWGFYWIPLRHVEQYGFSGAWSVILSSLLSLSVLIPLSIWRWNTFRNYRKPMLLIGLFTGMALGFYAMGLVYTTVVRATLLYYLTPIWCTIFGVFTLNEKVDRNRWFAILAGLAGLYFILGGASDLDVPLNIGDMFGIISGFVWAIGGVYLKKYPKVPITGSVTIQHFFSFLTAAMCGVLLLEMDNIPNFSNWVSASPVLWSYSFLGLIPGLFAVFWASGKLFPGRVGILMMSEVVVAVLSASILLDEGVQSLEWLGVILILSAGAMELRDNSTQHGPPSRQHLTDKHPSH